MLLVVLFLLMCTNSRREKCERNITFEEKSISINSDSFSGDLASNLEKLRFMSRYRQDILGQSEQTNEAHQNHKNSAGAS